LAQVVCLETHRLPHHDGSMRSSDEVKTELVSEDEHERSDSEHEHHDEHHEMRQRPRQQLERRQNIDLNSHHHDEQANTITATTHNTRQQLERRQNIELNEVRAKCQRKMARCFARHANEMTDLLMAERAQQQAEDEEEKKQHEHELKRDEDSHDEAKEHSHDEAKEASSSEWEGLPRVPPWRTDKHRRGKRHYTIKFKDRRYSSGK
jgi:hypothetical protein